MQQCFVNEILFYLCKANRPIIKPEIVHFASQSLIINANYQLNEKF